MTKRLDGSPPALALATTIASGIAVRHREPRVRPPAFHRSNGSGSALATSKVSDGSGAVTPLRTTRTLPGKRTRIEAPCTG